MKIDRPTVYKPPSSVSSGTSFSSRKNDFRETTAEPTTSNPLIERVPITIPIHKPLGSDVTSRRESFRVRPSLDRQSISRTGLMGRATLDSGSSVARAHTGQKRRLEEVLAQESNAPTHQDNNMGIDTLPLESQSVRSSTSIYSYKQSRHETSTYRSMVTEELQESVISRRLASPPSQNTPDATVDDRMSRSTTVRDASPISHIQRQPSPHSTHISPIHSPSLQLQRQLSPHSAHISPIHSPSLQLQRQHSPHSIHQSPVRSPSVSSRKSSISARSSRQSSVAPVEHERRSTSVHSRTTSPVSHTKASNVIHDMEMTLDENMEHLQKKDTTEGQETEYITITEKEGLEDKVSSHHEDEVLENVAYTNSEKLNKREPSVDVGDAAYDHEQEANIRDSMSQISVHDNTDEVISPKQATVTDNNSAKKPQSPIVDSNSQNNGTIMTNREVPTRSTVEPTVNTFHIDADDDIDYYDYTIQESEVGESSQGEYLGDITTEEISMKEKDITATMETQLNRLVASKLGNLHVESLHQLTTEAVRTLR